MEPERWADVANYPGYRVSTLGRVQSKRHRNGMPAADWRDLAPVPDGHGYPQVRLSNADGPRWHFVSRLVLAAFERAPVAGEVARHVLVNDPSDCRLTNLAWGTQAENCRDKERHGTDQRGERASGRHARLTRLFASVFSPGRLCRRNGPGNQIPRPESNSSGCPRAFGGSP
jgi:hypothetical protein